MTKDKRKLVSLELKKGGKVTLRDNTTCKIHGLGTIGMKNSLFLEIFLEKVLLVDGFKHNLLNISQLWDNSFM